MKSTELYDESKMGSWVSKEGQENFEEIESRKLVLNKLMEFINICEISKGLHACNIVGEWGQGKTELFNGFIKGNLEEKGHRAFFVSASTISNILENEKDVSVIEKSNLSAVRTLAAILEGVNEETGHEMPSLSSYRFPEEYIKDSLEFYLEDYDGSSRMFIFIDEFEEFLNTPENLKKIISGIKELINGRYKDIDEGGEFEGSIHLFISLTPDARYRLQTDEDISLIAGGYERRVIEVELNIIRKKEAIEFLKNLIDRLYNNSVPEPHPFGDYGIFDTLYRLSQGNFGNLKKIFEELFSRFKHDDFFEVIEYNGFIEFLKETRIHVFGAQTPCIDLDNYNKILNSLNNASDLDDNELMLLEKLFKILIAYSRPISVKELSYVLQVKDAKIHKYMRIINEKINGEFDIERAFIRTFPLKENLTFETFKKKLDDYISNDKVYQNEIIQIGNYSDLVDNFEDSITFFDFDSTNELKPVVFIPKKEKDLKEIFKSEVGEDYLIEIEEHLKDLVNDEETYYLISSSLGEIIYPTPVPRFLAYIQKKEERLSIWRNVSLKLAEKYDENIEKAFIEGLKRYDELNFREEKSDSSNVITIEEPDNEVAIRVLPKFITGDVKEDHIREIADILKEDYKIHACLIVYNGDFRKDARKLLKDAGLDKKSGTNQVLDLHLNQLLSKRILCAYESFEQDFVDKFLLDGEFRNILKDLKLKEMIKSWLKDQKKKGMVIDQIATSVELKKFVDTLKLYLNYINEPLSSDDVLKRNLEGILKFKLYGTKKGFIRSDLEDSPSKVKEISEELYENGFLGKDGDKYRVIEHPVEERIYSIIKRKKEVDENDIISYFILKSKQKNILRDLFLSIMEYKNRINRQQKNKLKITDLDKEYEDIKKHWEGCKKSIKNKEFYKGFGHVFMIKERNKKLILLDDFISFINDNITFIENYLESPKYEDAVRIKIYICKKLLNEIFSCNKNQRCLESLIRGAYKSSKDEFEKVEKRKNELETSFNKIIRDCKDVLDLNVEADSIKEYENLKKLFNDIHGIYEKSYSKEELKNIISEFKDVDLFKFNRKPSDAYYFNLKLYLIKDKIKSFNNVSKQIEDSLDESKRIIDEIKKKRTNFERKFKATSVPEELKISREFYAKIKDISIDGDLKAIKVPSLDQLKKRLKEVTSKLEKKLDDGSILLAILEDLIKREDELLREFNKQEDLLKIINDIFDNDKLNLDKDNFKKRLKEIRSDYDANTETFIKDRKKLDRLLSEKLDRLLSDLKRNLDSLENKWSSYIEEQQRFLKDYEKIRKSLGVDEETHRVLSEILTDFENKLNEDIKNQRLSAKELEDLKANIKKEFENRLRDYLNPDEIKLLKSMNSIKGKGIIDYEMIKKEASKKKINFEKAYKGLIAKGYIKLGFYFLK